MIKRVGRKPRRQIAALPVARDEDGRLLVLVITSRQNQRIIVPKGWPIPGVEDHEAAEIEAREEAGIVGRAHPKPIGSYLTWKTRPEGPELVKMKVFLLHAEAQLESWKEQGQRQATWLRASEAAKALDEPGLAQIVSRLPKHLPKRWRASRRRIRS